MGGFHVDGRGATRILVEVSHLIRARSSHMTEITLHDDVFARTRKEDVPYGGILDSSELARVAVKTRTHSQRLQLCSDSIENVSGALDAHFAVGVVGREAGNHEPRISNDPVEFDCFVE